jgi:hypothetical protein
MARRVVLLLSVVVALLLTTVTEGSAQPTAYCLTVGAPTFQFGFAALKSDLGTIMGEPASCEYADPSGTDDTLQDTTAGLAFWRRATNTPTFTDGWNHWGLTTRGLVVWAGTSIDPPAVNWSPPARAKTSGCTSLAGLPDAACTPGAVDSAVTQDTVQQTICVPGYTSKVRPPTSYTTPLKRQLMEAYGYVGLPIANYELDHLIALELGGAPRDPANLWPLARSGPANAIQKDAIENFLHRQVCDGGISLADAQQQVATDWRAVARP